MLWRCVGCLFGLGMVLAASAQQPAQQAAQKTTPVSTLSLRSNLVLAPALIKNQAGELVFSLKAEDFQLTDDGAPQTLRLEPDTDSQPLALVVLVETGGQGANHLREYRGLDAVLDAVIGAVPHRVAVVGFDSEPHLEQDFTADTDQAAEALNSLDAGDTGAATLDALRFGVDMLRRQPPRYRRAVLLVSETVDGGSQASFDETIRAVDDTNTAIYSFGFASARGALKHEASKLNSAEAGPAHGCMSREEGADPDANGSRAVQAFDCASQLLPPLRLARMGWIAARDGMRRNVPETVARLTGGEYFPFKDAKSLSRQLALISNDVPNHYVLTFRPTAPHAGFHALELRVREHPELNVLVRSAYWIEPEGER